MSKSSPKSPLVADEMANQEIHFRMEMIKENPNGSADFTVDCNEYTMAKLVELGVISLLKEHIAQQKKKPWWRIWK